MHNAAAEVGIFDKTADVSNAAAEELPLTYVCIISIYIYICIYRERDIDTCICIYIYIERERGIYTHTIYTHNITRL